jgi:hypothetical protein
VTDVFISYARADRNRVRPIALALAAEGFSVWWDPEIKPGAQWNAAIRKALENAACVLTCWSKKSVKSQWVVAETTHGHGRQVLAPALIQTCAPPIPFNMMQAADLSGWRGDGGDPEWIALLEQIRRLVEAKRRLVAAAPPPGEAHGAERVGAALAGGAADEAFRYTPGPSRLGPRLGRMLLGGAVLTAAITGGLWLAPQVVERFDARETKIAASPGAAPVSPPVVAAPEPSASAPVDAAPDTPVESPAVPPISPSPSTPTTVAPPVARPPLSTPTATSVPAPPPPQTADATRQLDACVNRLAAMCPNANGQARGFAADARLSAEEAAFLTTVQITATSPASPEAAQACEGMISQRSASGRRRGTLFDQACVAISFPAPQQQATPVPRDVIEAIPGILTPNRDPPRPSTTSAAPRTGRFSLRLGQWANFTSGGTSADGGDIGLAQARSGPYLAGGQTAQIGLAPGGRATLDVCRQASYGASLMLDRLQAGSGFCVRRTDGVVVGAQVADTSREAIIFSYTAWPAQ